MMGWRGEGDEGAGERSVFEDKERIWKVRKNKLRPKTPIRLRELEMEKRKATQCWTKVGVP